LLHLANTRVSNHWEEREERGEEREERGRFPLFVARNDTAGQVRYKGGEARVGLFDNDSGMARCFDHCESVLQRGLIVNLRLWRIRRTLTPLLLCVW
jgi:hypothetical protein